MKVISFVNSKGGCGKTTSVINIATCLSLQGKYIAVIDTDPQESVLHWNKNKTSVFDIYSSDNEKDIYKVRQNLNNYDYVLIDGAANLSIVTAACVMVSDLVIIPVRPSPLDFSASGSVITILEAQSYSRNIECRFLITCKINNTLMLNILRNSIDNSGRIALQTAITHRQLYIRALLNGGTVFDTRNGQAKAEIELISNEIIEIIES